MRKRNRLVILTVGALALLIFGFAVVRPGWWRICGNTPISYYGSIIGDDGKGVAGVKVTFDVIYSAQPALPVMYGKGERKWVKTVTTNAAGCFQVVGIYGYSIRVSRVQWNEQRVGLVAVGVPPKDDPGYGVRMDERTSRRTLPDTPAKRVAYRIVDLKE